MALAALIVVIGAVVGAVWLLARRAAWADVHPPLAPIECFGDWIALPLEARNAPRGSVNRAGGGSATVAPRRNATHDGEAL
jgi:hypothetical protein